MQNKNHINIKKITLVAYGLLFLSFSFFVYSNLDSLNNFKEISFQKFVAATEWGTVGPKYPPRDLTAVVSSTEIKLSWNTPTDSTGLSGYKIFRCDNSSDCYPTIEIATTENLSYADTSILSSTPYRYAIRGYGSSTGLSPISNIVSVTSPNFWATSAVTPTTQETTASTSTTTATTTPTTTQTTSPTTETTSTATIATIFTEKLYVGIKSEQVTQLQTFLAKFPEIYPEAKITGYYWKATYNAVGKFQIKYGIVANSSSAGYGIVGPKTRDKLNELLSSQ